MTVHASNKPMKFERIEAALQSIAMQLVGKLIDSMPRRCEAVRKEKSLCYKVLKLVLVFFSP